MKWNILPIPIWPAGRSTYGNVDFYAINRATRHPDQAWELMKWLTAETAWQRFQMRTTLVQPCLLSLWDEWETTVTTAAPVMRGKDLNWYKEAALGGYAYPVTTFRYAPFQVMTVIGNYLSQMLADKISAPLGLQQMQRQVDALETAGVQQAGALQAAQAQVTHYTAAAADAHAPIRVPAPPRSGPGTAAVNAPTVVHTGTGGTWTIRGAGAGVTGTSDGCTFACAPWTSTAGEFTCRLVSLAAVGGTSIANGAKVGLMARANLASSAATVFLDVAAGRGMHFMTRAVDTLNIADTHQPPATQASGLFGDSFILSDNSKPAANYILRPVWLRLRLSVDAWTAFTSLDGAHWTQAGTHGIEAVGGWIGLAVTSYQSGHYVQAVFDYVFGFQPNTFVRIGSV